jgi:outer membrane lipopolysaccharide assembly protein LptE/RlpB
MDPRTRVMLLPVLLASILVSAGCGYSFYNRASLPFAEIRIGNIENMTPEPKLQDKLYQALVEEFAKYGVTVTPRAAPVLSGVIRNFSMVSLSEKDDITVEYQFMIGADFTYQDSTGKIREIKNRGLPFIVSFSGAGALQNLLANKTAAEKQAMSDLAKSVIGTLIY